MEVSLRGIGTFVPALRGLAAVTNPDGTISVVIDPNAGNVAPTTTPTPTNTINYAALGVDPVVADGAGGICPASQLVNNLCPAGESCAVTGDCYVPTVGGGGIIPTASGSCPTGQILNNGLCVQAVAGIPTTTVFYIMAAILALFAFSKGGR